MQAQKSLSAISNNRDLWIAQYRQDVYETDRISGLYAAEKRGELAKAQSAARNALAMGLSQAQVSQITGLSIEEIQKL